MELNSFFPSFVHQRLLLFPPNCFCLSTAVAGFPPLFTSVCCSLLTVSTSLQPLLVFILCSPAFAVQRLLFPPN